MTKKTFFRFACVLLAIFTCVSFPIQSEAGRGTALVQTCSRVAFATSKSISKFNKENQQNNQQEERVQYVPQEENNQYIPQEPEPTIVQVNCEYCGGTGCTWDDNAQTISCPICYGNGKVYVSM